MNAISNLYFDTRAWRKYDTMKLIIICFHYVSGRFSAKNITPQLEHHIYLFFCNESSQLSA